MILDSQVLFSGSQASGASAITGQAITASAASTNIYDTGAAADVGFGNILRFFVSVGAAFNNLTSLDVQLQTSVDAAFTSPVILQDVNVLLAGLTANTKISTPSPTGGFLRYIRFYYVVNGTAPSTGTVIAGLVQDKQDWASVPNELGL